MAKRPLKDYEDHEIIAEVFRRDLKLGDFAQTLLSDDAAVLSALRSAMERPYDPGPLAPNRGPATSLAAPA